MVLTEEKLSKLKNRVIEITQNETERKQTGKEIKRTSVNSRTT